ncbi:MAG: HAMP domain-containing protein [Elusimicrobia bacterium]|nr:HAMP domain-containing protein [Elusimicrobiota bacterium]
MAKPSSFWRKFHKLHLGLYVLFSLMTAFGSITCFYFEKYSLIDFGLAKTELAKFTEAQAAGRRYSAPNRILERIFPTVEFNRDDGEPKPAGDGGVKYTTRKNSSDDWYFVFLLVWLLPLYKYYFSKKPQDLEKIKRRITFLPAAVFFLSWLAALLHFLGTLVYYTSHFGPATWRVKLIFGVSSLILGTFAGYLNLELTGLYIRSRIARPFFLETDPYGLKPGFAVSLNLRYALMIFSLAIVPLLLSVYLPVISSLDLFERLFAGGSLNWALSLENLRVFIPIVATGSLVALMLVFQLVSILLYRYNVQAPVSALVGRMKAVAAGDFSCKTTVLYNDELGQLKGHFNMMLDGLVERDHIKDTFGRYVSMEIAEKIMKSGKVNLAGEEIQATVLFSDIRGFTPLSEKMPAPELIKFLNDYFSHITAPIADNKGVINKFIGDAVMAIFSPVFGVEDHREAALRAAIGMTEALKRFNAQGRHPEVNFGVGIHSGGLVAGNVGTEARLEYTVLGDTVNVASRIETQTKAAGTQILISRAVMDGVDKAHFPGVNFVECEPVVMKGKSSAMVLYKAERA